MHKHNVPGVNYAYNKANDGTAPITRVKYHHTKFIEIKKSYIIYVSVLDCIYTNQ